VVNVGSTASPDYRLSLTASNLGALTLDLTDSAGTSVIDESNTGSLATYQVAGQSDILSSDSRTVTVAPGLTAQLLSQNTTGNPTTITVSNDATAIGAAFSSFATAYNQASTDLAQYHGKGGGALEGDSIVDTLTNVLQQLSDYSNGNASTALANFGITVDDTGKLSVDTSALATAATANWTTFTSTLGAVGSGGFLDNANNLLNSVEDPTQGSLKVEETTVSGEVTAQNTVITNEQAKITQIQANITAEMVQADAAISALESQVSYVNGLFYSITGNNNNPNAAAS
jgi:hypothetical protein